MDVPIVVDDSQPEPPAPLEDQPEPPQPVEVDPLANLTDLTEIPEWLQNRAWDIMEREGYRWNQARPVINKSCITPLRLSHLR